MELVIFSPGLASLALAFDTFLRLGVTGEVTFEAPEHKEQNYVANIISRKDAED